MHSARNRVQLILKEVAHIRRENPALIAESRWAPSFIPILVPLFDIFFTHFSLLFLCNVKFFLPNYYTILIFSYLIMYILIYCIYILEITLKT